jgi:hypothetical protein
MKLGTSTLTWRLAVDVIRRERWAIEYRGVYQFETAPRDTDCAGSLVALEKSTYDLACRAEVGGDFLVRCEDHALRGEMA